MIVNSLGRELPEKIGDYIVRPYMGPATTPALTAPVVTRRTAGHRVPGDIKLKASLKDAVIASGLKDGMTISFHHCFREGDRVIGQVLTVIRELGIKSLRFAPSAVVNIKNPSIVDFVRDGTIDRIEASGIRGQLGDAVLDGEMEKPVILRTHGARPRAIEAGELQIDVAFIGASAADDYGNCTGQIGPNACGSMFVFYFGVIAAITPPVALASYAGAGLAGADANRTGWSAVKIGLAGFILPYMFILRPAILGQGTVFEIVQTAVIATIAVMSLSASMRWRSGWVAS